MNKICKHCGKEFTTNKSGRKFCCYKCYIDYRHGITNTENTNGLVKVVCAECGLVEYVLPSRAKKYKYCSRECMGKYNSKKYNKQVELICPICGKTYYCKQSKINHHRTCGDSECRKIWLQQTRRGKNNSNYKKIEIDLINTSVKNNNHDKSKTIYQHVVKEILGLNSVKDLPKGYVIHHKDCNHNNNIPTNLVVLPKHTHRILHTKFGNIILRNLHNNLITKEQFFSLCNNEEIEFYKNIIDLNITHQVVLKQGELLEHPGVGNQQPSIYRNIIEGSTTNDRDLTCDDEVSNVNTSVLQDDIV